MALTLLDLKIENILISQSGDVKIIDFGLSNTFSRDSLLKTFCGSLYFAAPELLSAHPYTGPEIDVWSFGVVLFVLVCGKVPFDDQSMPALHAKIKRGYVEYPSWISSDCRDLLSRMLVVDPTQRATLAEVKRHPWMIKGYDKPPDSYIPFRRPITLPLDPNVIREMSGFEFGSEDKIMADMHAILESPQYITACQAWYKLHGGDPNDVGSPLGPRTSRGHGHSESMSYDRRSRHFGLDFYKRRSSLSSQDQSLSPTVSTSAGPPPDPTNAYHPLLSIYYLVTERQERERKAKLEREKSTFAQQQLLQQQQQQAQQQQQQQYRLQQQQFLQQQQQYQQQQQQLQQQQQQQQYQQLQQQQQQLQQQQLLQQQQQVQEHTYSSKHTSLPPSATSAKFTAPVISVPEAVHTASSPVQAPSPNPNVVLPVPRTRARAKTQGDLEETEVAFSFGGNSQPAQAVERVDPPPDNSSNGGSSLASSLLRRFSSKRKPVRDNSVVAQQAQPQVQVQAKPSYKGHSQNFSQPANFILPDIMPDSPLSNSFQPPAQSSGIQEHRTPRKPVASGNAEALARSVSSRPPSQPKFSPFETSADNSAVQKSTKKYHPSARAKSMGHARGDMAAQQMLARQREEAIRPRVSGASANPDTADIADAFFDAPFDSSHNSNNSIQKPQTRQESYGDLQVSDLKRQDSVVGMPSIEFPKQVFLKGFFSVQSTSTKSLAFIRSDIIRVLNHLGVEYKEIKGGFACIHRPSIRGDEDPFAGSGSNIPSNTHNGHLSPPTSPAPPNTGFPERGHWRKLSFGSGFFNSRRRNHQNESSGNIVDFSDYSTESVTGGQQSGFLGGPSSNAGNSDMLGSAKSSAVAAARTPLQFEIWIVRVPLLSLHGVQFKKLRGNSWLYKSLASKILAELRL